MDKIYKLLANGHICIVIDGVWHECEIVGGGVKVGEKLEDEPTGDYLCEVELRAKHPQLFAEAEAEARAEVSETTAPAKPRSAERSAENVPPKAVPRKRRKKEAQSD